MRLLKNISVFYKLLISVNVLVVLIAIILYFFIDIIGSSSVEKIIRRDLKNSTESTVDLVKNLSLLSMETSLKNITDRNFTFIAYIYQQFWDGYISEEEAFNMVSDYINTEKHDKSGVVDILNRNCEIIYTSSETHSYKSKCIFDVMSLKNGEGFVDMEFSVTGKSVKSLSYIRYFEPWNWYISSNIEWKDFIEIINFDFLKKYISEMTFGENGYPMVIDTNGNFIIHPHKDTLEKDSAQVKYIMERFLKDINGNFVYYWKNPTDKISKKKMTYFIHIPEMEWIVASTSYFEDFSQTIKNFRLFILTGMIFLLILSFPFIFIVTRKLTEPVLHLTKRFKKGAEGDFTVRAEIDTDDEIGNLARFFNIFMENIEKSNKIKQEFLNNMSHEIKTPMTHILGYSELLKKEKDIGKIIKYADIVMESSNRLLLIINNILEVSRITSDTVESNFSKKDLNLFLQKIENDFSGYLNENNNIFKVRFPDFGAVLNTDLTRLEILLTEILKNSFKFSKDSSIYFYCEKINNSIEFTIKDKGIGIKEENLKNIFNDFFQEDSSMNRKYDGTGLGLGLVFRIKDYLGANIEVGSEEGCGTEFKIRLRKDQVIFS